MSLRNEDMVPRCQTWARPTGMFVEHFCGICKRSTCPPLRDHLRDEDRMRRMANNECVCRGCLQAPKRGSHPASSSAFCSCNAWVWDAIDGMQSAKQDLRKADAAHGP